MITPPPFDAVAYAANSSAYLSTTEPGRVFQTAQPGAGVPVLTPVGLTAFTLRPGGSAILAVQAPAGQPISYVSTDLGSFGNGLVSITVAADASGVGRATLTATPGTSGRVNILAGSPVATGQVRFVVDVLGDPMAPVPPVPPSHPPEAP